MNNSLQREKSVEITPYLVNATVVLLVALAFPLANIFPPTGELIRWLDNFSYRWQIHYAPMPDTSEVRIIHFDRHFFDETGVRATPLDRASLGDVLEQVARSKPAVIVVDIDLRYRLRSGFEKSLKQYPVTTTWLDELDAADDRLTRIINRIVANGTPVVLGMPAETSPEADPMAFDTANAALYFGRTTAWIRSIDRVIYGLPTMLTPEKAIDTAVTRSAQPSLALAAWAAYQGLPSSTLLSGVVPAGFDKEQLSLWQTISGGEELFVNWYRLDPRGQPILIPRLSAVALTRSDKPIAKLKGKVAVIGRSHFITEPIQEQPDHHSTPFPDAKKIDGLSHQALFIDNLLNNSYLTKSGWWLALAVSSGLGILLGSAFLCLGMHTEAISTLGYWGQWLSHPLLSLAVGLVLSLTVTLLVNLLFLQKGMYMSSLALIPLAGFIEAVLYTVWTLRP
uniref:CHASE2 domain-containing protein n=1 Tax=Candidatus Kentrum sp. LPFa TaxID=2126335 RepID=A0A450XI14_9GAMM|nr:MAG: CHASE2 domain-containing protein [Candidatus Kentron sp. LPFa]VFK28879.1 MAG: CHASE2 domain-containing protein [Candidatus Kentron sp. LPFa]